MDSSCFGLKFCGQHTDLFAAGNVIYEIKYLTWPNLGESSLCFHSEGWSCESKHDALADQLFRLPDFLPLGIEEFVEGQILGIDLQSAVHVQKR